MREVVIDDARFTSRIVRASIYSIIFMVGAFFVIAMVYECPNEAAGRPGFLKNLRCEEYIKIKTASDEIFVRDILPEDKEEIPVI